MSESRLLITGAGGFLGSHVARHLAGKPVSVLLLTHKSPPPLLPETHAVRHVSVLSPDWMKGVEDFHPDAIVHAATRFQVTHDRSDIPAMLHANVQVGTQLLDIAHELGAHFITTSTAWQQYRGLPRSPVNLYAATKQAFDSIADYYRGEGLRLSRLFLFDVYGPQDRRRKLVPLLLEAARSRIPMDATSGKQLIDLTYVDDVVRAICELALGTNQAVGSDVVLKSGPVTVRHVADVLEDVTGQPVPVNWGTVPDRPKEMMEDWHLEPVLFNWSPKVSLKEGLGRVWNSEGAGE